MKNTYILLVAFLLMLSCDILEPEPQQSLDSSTALVDAGSAKGILGGIYTLLQDPEYYGSEYPLNCELLSDNAIFEGFYQAQAELDQNSVPISNLWITTIWPDIYVVVNSANLLISGVDAIEDPALDKDAIRGEAYALRALANFDLLRYFGEHFDNSSEYGIPLLLEPIPENDFNQIPDIARSSVAAVYEQIIDDLDLAVALTEGSSDTSTMNYWAALSLRARANLYRGEYGQAFIDANKVITEGGFSLEANLDDVFYTTDASAESIFELEFNEQDQSAYNTYLYRRDEFNVDPSLLNAFETGDLRKNYFTVLRGRDRTTKYSDNTNSNNFKIFRLSELYLIRSEAAVFSTNDPDAGTDDLNTIRNRAGLGDLDPILNTSQYVNALLYERRAELNFEGHRFFDLVRFEKAESVLGLEAFRKVLPIPRTELQVSDALVQNPGYPSN